MLAWKCEKHTETFKAYNNTKYSFSGTIEVLVLCYILFKSLQTNTNKWKAVLLCTSEILFMNCNFEDLISKNISRNLQFTSTSWHMHPLDTKVCSLSIKQLSLTPYCAYSEQRKYKSSPSGAATCFIITVKWIQILQRFLIHLVDNMADWQLSIIARLSPLPWLAAVETEPEVFQEFLDVILAFFLNLSSILPAVYWKNKKKKHIDLVYIFLASKLFCTVNHIS